ncbi:MULTISPECIES: TetR/AcrR family transcriptional regulator [unclassified Streptomyces]|uniref:TetR/AcrR family transcriptional regulator n=1 Tax=Streptomyces TaxID=1883 RepID=UPI0001C1A32C|nr:MULTISPECIES: TetR/AcrR family transcriptional regulator [unclassified Streptomyces]AEN13477.1 transcriptional regulator, TetR family [Streptomyces sp. SirexAA-E]MYR64459.1 TetR family transcriptional regulator [Streptomyces sp. SID4939]MYS02523.1 TetR family transcriptional regulator [Streptomyces sp. SID4940]MYT67075.1 TetR family transcriptional regulator [Streptomyces sp. SID8357]MYT84719.1 TetR family transcriptional regulator [Streptomyces sp. SID8360]
MPRPPSTMRRHILDSALRLFAEHGFKGASLHDIAAEAHCSKASLLYHFASKDAMLTELLTPPAESLRALSEELAALDGDQAVEPAVRGYVGLAMRFHLEIKIIFAELPDMLGHPVLAVIPRAVDQLADALAGRSDRPRARVMAQMVIGGVAVTVAADVDVEQDMMRAELTQGALRTLGRSTS